MAIYLLDERNSIVNIPLWVLYVCMCARAFNRNAIKFNDNCIWFFFRNVKRKKSLPAEERVCVCVCWRQTGMSANHATTNIQYFGRRCKKTRKANRNAKIADIFNDFLTSHMRSSAVSRNSTRFFFICIWHFIIFEFRFKIEWKTNRTCGYSARPRPKPMCEINKNEKKCIGDSVRNPNANGTRSGPKARHRDRARDNKSW